LCILTFTFLDSRRDDKIYFHYKRGKQSEDSGVVCSVQAAVSLMRCGFHIALRRTRWTLVLLTRPVTRDILWDEVNAFNASFVLSLFTIFRSLSLVSQCSVFIKHHCCGYTTGLFQSFPNVFIPLSRS
jgi:hypothetical protein